MPIIFEGITISGGISIVSPITDTQKAIFGYGVTNVAVSMTYNLAAAAYG